MLSVRYAGMRRVVLGVRKPSAQSAHVDSSVSSESALSSPRFVVGIGASAGGLEALEAFFDHLPGNTGASFVVIQHLSPDYKSLMVELLSKHTPMAVVRAEDAQALERNTIYLLPPRKNLVVHDGHLRLLDKDQSPGSGFSVDIFLRALAEDAAERSVAVILSGSGTDGSAGARAVKAAGGAVMVQDPEDARFDGMPRGAAAIADFVAPAASLPGILVDYLQRVPSVSRAPSPSEEQALHADILVEVKRASGIDFSAYKRGTIVRRIERRMAVLHVPTLEDYAARVRQDPDEAEALHREFLISVTKFFRDPEAFTTALARVVPSILADTPEHGELRVWVPGCATGEEAYSWAIGLLEAIHGSGRHVGVRIFGTDVDEDALQTAMAGIYPLSVARDLGEERLARWFTTSGDHVVVSRELRSMLLFAKHDVSRDPPFSRMDLVSCRNLLIYLEGPLQRRVLSFLHFALRPSRYLMLGTSETTGELGDRFHVVSPKWKLYQAVGRPTVLDAIPNVTRLRAEGAPRATSALARDVRVDDAQRELLETYAPPAILVSESGQLVHSFGRASELLRVAPGAANLNVLAMLPRPLSSVLMVALPRAVRESKPLHYPGIEVSSPDRGTEAVSLTVRPIGGGPAEAPLLLVLFERRSRPEPSRTPDTESASDQGAMRNLERELEATKESLQSMIEELETSNEELQATNEELVSSNEELQSTNEELQSLNEELHTVNSEYQAKIEELSRLNQDMDNLLASTSVGTLFLDDHLLIRRFTPAVQRIVRVLPRDIGRPLADLALQLPDALLLHDVEQTLLDRQPRERELRTQDGSVQLLRVLPYIVDGAPAPGIVVTFVDVTAVKDAEARTQSIIDSLAESVAVVGPDGVITAVNASWDRALGENGGKPERSGVGTNYLSVCYADEGDRHAREAAEGITAVLSGRAERFSLEYPCQTPRGLRHYIMHVAPYRRGLENGSSGAVISHIDVTLQR